MRVCSFLLVAAAATILASSEAFTTSESMELTSAQGVQSINGQRSLRSHQPVAEEEEEERATINLTTLDDLLKLDDLLDPKKVGTKVEKVAQHSKQKVLFDRMFANPTVKDDVLKRIAESGDQGKWLKSKWYWYNMGKGAKHDNKEIAAALRRKRNTPSTS